VLGPGEVSMAYAGVGAVPMAPDACYPEVLKAVRWAVVTPVDFPGWFSTFEDTFFSWSYLVLFLSLLGLNVVIWLFFFVRLRSFQHAESGCLWGTFVLCYGLVVLSFLAAGSGAWSAFGPSDAFGLCFMGIFFGAGLWIATVFCSANNYVDGSARLTTKVERLGTAEFLRSRRFWVDKVHEDAFGKLVRTRLGWGGPWLWAVVVKCPTTGREYALSVDSELRPIGRNGALRGEGQVKTARNAVASTFGLRGEQYAPGLQT